MTSIRAGSPVSATRLYRSKRSDVRIAGKDVVEIVAEDEAPVHADHSLGIAVEEDEFEVADLAGGVGDAVIEDDGVGTGFSGCYQAKFVVARARRVPDDESKAAHGDGEASDEDGRRDGAGPGEQS